VSELEKCCDVWRLYIRWNRGQTVDKVAGVVMSISSLDYDTG